MAIIVDKEQKRRDIALSCSELLLEKGIKKLTVAEVAKTAGVSKGSIYDYFENKEDIVFEIIGNEIEQYQVEFEKKIDSTFSTKEKIVALFSFLLDENEWNLRHQNLYKEYMSIDLGGENEKMSEFNTGCSDFFKEILIQYFQEGIEKGEIKKEALGLVDGFTALEKGFLILGWTENRDVKSEFKGFLDSLFNLIEVK